MSGMDSTVPTDALIAVLAAIARDMPEHEAHLGELDAAIGDGDHGLTITRCCGIVERRLPGCIGLSPSAVLRTIGDAITDGSGGAIGPLLGTAFVAAGKAVVGRERITGQEIPAMLAAAQVAIEELGGARVGDKTLLDALAPAAAAARTAALAGEPGAAVLAAAAAAAADGAARTAEMTGGVGKAGRWGDAAVGHADPGAVSVSLMLRSAADELVRRSR
jgi:dihydroxyacetone kinase-like protein